MARSLTGAEQAALALQATLDDTPRKYFSLSPVYAPWRDYRTDPKGLGLHGLELPPGEAVRLTQEEVERGWLATAICGESGYRYGLLQLSDKRAGADFTEEDEVRLRELADLVAPRSMRCGSATTARLRTSQLIPLGRLCRSVRSFSQDGSNAREADQVVVRPL